MTDVLAEITVLLFKPETWAGEVWRGNTALQDESLCWLFCVFSLQTTDFHIPLHDFFHPTRIFVSALLMLIIPFCVKSVAFSSKCFVSSLFSPSVPRIKLGNKIFQHPVCMNLSGPTLILWVETASIPSKKGLAAARSLLLHNRWVGRRQLSHADVNSVHSTFCRSNPSLPKPQSIC